MQSEGQGSSNGVVRLWRRLHHEHADENTCVELRSWWQDWGDLAELIKRTQPDPDSLHCDRVRVKIYAYSWGGMSALKLATQLAIRNIQVRALVLCDAVYRHWYYAGQWRAFMPWSQLRVPSNVMEVYRLVQQNPRFRISKSWPCNWLQPAGHDVVRENACALTPKIFEPKILSCDHSHMDNAEEFHAMAMMAASAV
jgi:pimeloyl-ACP methyl ester carboxylesterase